MGCIKSCSVLYDALGEVDDFLDAKILDLSKLN